MADILFWSAIGGGGLVAAACGFLYWRSFREYQKRRDAEHEAWMQKERADDSKRTAEIFSKPRGSKSDIIKRL